METTRLGASMTQHTTDEGPDVIQDELTTGCGLSCFEVGPGLWSWDQGDKPPVLLRQSLQVVKRDAIQRPCGRPLLQR